MLTFRIPCHSPRIRLTVLLIAIAVFNLAAVPGSAQTEVLKDYDPSGQIRFSTPEAAKQKRRELVRYIWPKGFPADVLPKAEKIDSKQIFQNELSGIDGKKVASVRRLNNLISPYDFNIISFLLYPESRSSNSERLVIVHSGHRKGRWIGAGVNDAVNTLLGKGYNVLLMDMPLYGWNTDSTIRLPNQKVVDVNVNKKKGPHPHNDLFEKVQPHLAKGEIFRFFVEPVVQGINYFRATHPESKDVSMIGLSGGGWTTHLVAAVDIRILKSFPVAGSMPLYARKIVPASEGDAEQIFDALYREIDTNGDGITDTAKGIASYLEIYALSGFGTGRCQIQILNYEDTCCFSTDAYKSYSGFVADAVKRLGQGEWRVHSDRTHKKHIISRAAMDRVILPELDKKITVDRSSEKAATHSPRIRTEISIDRTPVKKPNILLIMADDVGCDAIGCYGGQSYPTPHIDALAKGGMRYSHGYSMSVCHPSRICLMTGRYPFRFGASGSKWGGFPVKAESMSIGHRLRSAGYNTAVAGKWQLCMMKNDLDHPRRLGFDKWCLFGWHEGARYTDPMIYQNGHLRGDTDGKYGPDLYVDFLSKFMEDSHREGKPFFAYYPMALCHDVTDDLKGKQVAPFRDRRWMTYAEMMASMDDMVGRLVYKLESMGIRDETLVLFTTDNGTAAASYHRVDNRGKMIKTKVFSIRNGKVVPGGKGKTDDTGTRVPLIANWPSQISAGQTTDTMVDLTDYLPTLSAIASAPDDQYRRDGISFASELTRGKKNQTGRRWIYVQHKNKSCVRSRDWKLYRDGRLYHVKKDPLETTPVSTESLNASGQAALMELQTALAKLKGPLD